VTGDGAGGREFESLRARHSFQAVRLRSVVSAEAEVMDCCGHEIGFAPGRGDLLGGPGVGEEVWGRGPVFPPWAEAENPPCMGAGG
jgi:hypothetical protein